MIRKKKRILLLLLFNLVGLAKINAKDYDTGAWTDLSLTTKIHAATYGLMGEYYLRNDCSSLERMSIGLKGDYLFRSWLSGGAGYLLMNFKRPGYMELRDRFYVQLEPTLHFNKFFFSIRERMQFTLFPETRTNAPNTLYWRNRFEICHKSAASRIEPLVDFETWYNMAANLETPMEELRFLVGANCVITSHQRIKLYGLFIDGLILNRFIMGVSYEIRL